MFGVKDLFRRHLHLDRKQFIALPFAHLMFISLANIGIFTVGKKPDDS